MVCEDLIAESLERVSMSVASFDPTADSPVNLERVGMAAVEATVSLGSQNGFDVWSYVLYRCLKASGPREDPEVWKLHQPRESRFLSWNACFLLHASKERRGAVLK